MHSVTKQTMLAELTHSCLKILKGNSDQAAEYNIHYDTSVTIEQISHFYNIQGESLYFLNLFHFLLLYS
jgi:hypothetical protein